MIDLGTREARAHLLTGWSIDELWRGKTTFVWAMGRSATVRFTRFTSGPFTLYFRCLPFAPPGGGPPQEITTLVNGTQVGTTRLDEADFQTYAVAVPAAALRSGDNQVEFRFAWFRAEPPDPNGAPAPRRIAVAWDWIGVGVKSAAAAAPAAAVPPLVPRAGALLLPFRTRVTFFVDAQPGSVLRWRSIAAWNAGKAAAAPGTAATAASAGAAVEVQVDWEGASGHPVRFEQASFATPANLPLTNLKTAAARVSFVAWPGKGADGAAGLLLDAPELVPAGCPEAAAAGSGAPATPAGAAAPNAGAAGGGPVGAAPNVVVYMIDTLRADHLGVYGYPRPISPEIDAFAARSTVFTHAFAQSGWTKSAVATMLTGLYPLSHGVLDRMDALREPVRTLPQMLRAAGYQTLGISTNPAVSSEAGLTRGFDRFVELVDRGTVPFVAQPSDKVDAELFRWLAERDAGRPFFAYLHTMDAHEPYLPPPAYRQRFAAKADAALCRPAPKDVSAALAARPGLGRDGIRDNFEALYDAQIAHNDSQFGLVLRRLRDLGLYDKTLVVLISDHGEEFLDHGLFAHGHSLYQEILHVPLIVHWPDAQDAGRRVAAPAQQIDLLPTALAAAGIAVPAAYPGVDLRRLARQDAMAEREVVSDLSLAGTRISSLVTGGMHLLVRESPNPDAELYDLGRDPREQHDVADPAGVRFGFLLSRLRTLTRAQSRDAAPRTSPIPAELDRQLRSLGYV